jgi:hypothetical protein
MEEEHLDKTRPKLRQSMNGSCGDISSGFRACPFCCAVIPWESERCPSCGRILIERVVPSPSQTPPSVSRSAASVRLVLARMRHTVLRVGWSWMGMRPAPRDTWATTSRGTS